MTDADFLRSLAVATPAQRTRLEAIADTVEQMSGVDRIQRDAYMLQQIAGLREHIAKLESRMGEAFPEFR